MAAQCSWLRPASAPACTPGACEQDRNRFHAILAGIAIAQALAAHRTAAVAPSPAGASARLVLRREPLNKSRVAATAAFRDEMHEATPSPSQAPRATAPTNHIPLKTPSL